jgi:hypothetical protein
MSANIHEQFSRGEAHSGSSDRGFGFVFTGLFLVLGLLPLRKGQPPRIGFLIAAAVMLLLALAFPGILAPFNMLWTRLSLLMGKVMTPVVLGLMYYLVFTPAAAILRMFGRDPLRLKPTANTGTFWIPRQDTVTPESMKHLF